MPIGLALFRVVFKFFSLAARFAAADRRHLRWASAIEERRDTCKLPMER